MVATAHELPYPITIAAGVLDRLGDVVRQATPGSRVAAITDQRVGELYGDRISRVLPPGATVLRAPLSEATKTRESWARLTDELLALGFGRDTTIVAVGGGVVGDVAGFVAATYMRGVAYVQVPTTLLAMVDASIGGKTGVDVPLGKNLVGAFHPPVAVVIDPQLLKTLPPEHRQGGFAEVIKHGVVADAGYFQQAVDFLRSGGIASDAWDEWTPLITRSVEIKADIVSRDELEAGLRKVLNLGHTLGHAIEAASGYRMMHGHAVAIGMVAEARIAHLLGIADPGLAAVIEDACRGAGLPTRLSREARGADVASVIGFTRTDKKARAGRVEYALPARIGEMAGADRGYGTPVDDDIVRQVLTS